MTGAPQLPRQDDGQNTCRRGHERTPENSYIRADGYPRCRICERETSRRFYVAHPGYSTPYTRDYRSDPEKREKDRERSRRWKEANREANRQRDREYARRKREEASNGNA